MKIKELLSFILKKLRARTSPDSEINESISPSEVLSRFLFQSSHFSSNRVKQAAFLPAKNLETSVFRKTKLVEFSLYDKTKDLISLERGKKIKAIALIQADKIGDAIGLTIEVEESQHKWHANIVGWPQEKHEQKQLAQILAKNSSLE